MDKIQKVLRKLKKKDRHRLLIAIERLVEGGYDLDIKKLINTNCYRLRSGRFRIIFHKEGDRIILDDIGMRNDNTYK